MFVVESKIFYLLVVNNNNYYLFIDLQQLCEFLKRTYYAVAPCDQFNLVTLANKFLKVDKIRFYDIKRNHFATAVALQAHALNYITEVSTNVKNPSGDSAGMEDLPF